jgi:protein-tyrosine phosphatase
MVDIHSHVLWGVDDGARSCDESLAMLGVARQHGTTDIVATPHASMRYRFHPDLVRERVGQLAAESASAKLKIHWGCDFHLSFDNVEDALRCPSRYTINGGPYLLVEFPDHSIKGMSRILASLLDRGLIPVMTHPERNRHLRSIPADFREWLAKGCLVQITAQSLLGRFGKEAEHSAWEMIRRDMAHFLASDAHDPKDRTPRLDEAFAAVTRRMGEAVATRLLVDNPGAVIAGRKIEHTRQRRPSWFTWRSS